MAATTLRRKTAVSADYPRDLIGYANTPPHPHWPGDARIALSFVLNYEEGGERNLLHGDKESEAFLSEMVDTGSPSAAAP
jgi:peptidoglycan/xylan/chitin deacetylase (PgdA/CDA1 family)